MEFILLLGPAFIKVLLIKEQKASRTNLEAFVFSLSFNPSEEKLRYVLKPWPKNHVLNCGLGGFLQPYFTGFILHPLTDPLTAAARGK